MTQTIGTSRRLPAQLDWRGENWTVILVDDATAERIALSRGWDPEISEENHVAFVDGTEAEISFTFHTLEEAIHFAEMNYSCNPPNWPMIDGERGQSAHYDGARWEWERTG